MNIEQAIYGGQDVGGYRFLARSPGFRDDWLPEAERLCAAFGERPAGVACPAAVFARPFASRHVAIVQVADQGHDDAGRRGALAFRLLILTRRLYADLVGDLFFITDQYPPPWQERGELATLTWTAGAAPPRTVADLRKILDVDHTRTATLLGGVQILVDGGRVVFVRKAPDASIIRDLWALLPNKTRLDIWPATFAFGNKHGFHLLVVASAAGAEFEHYVAEQTAGDYPEGSYEYALQHAVESGDQRELDGLLARQSRRQMLWLAGVMLIVFLLAGVLLQPNLPTPAGPKKAVLKEKDKETLQLPPAKEFAPLTAGERQKLAQRLAELSTKLQIKLPLGDSEEALGAALGQLDQQIDARLGERRPGRETGKLADLGPVQRQLRAILWKHGDVEYAQTGPNAVELVERLQLRLSKEGLIKEEKP